jgi:hypothetical protein
VHYEVYIDGELKVRGGSSQDDCGHRSEPVTHESRGAIPFRVSFAAKGDTVSAPRLTFHRGASALRGVEDVAFRDQKR